MRKLASFFDSHRATLAALRRRTPSPRAIRRTGLFRKRQALDSLTEPLSFPPESRPPSSRALQPFDSSSPPHSNSRKSRAISRQCESKAIDEGTEFPVVRLITNNIAAI